MVKKPCKDHLGNEFPSIGEMCRHYQINQSTFNDRIKKGWSMEKALTAPLKPGYEISSADHLGNKFSSTKEMCECYSISPTVFCDRIKKGWSLEKALTTHIGNTVTDHLGNKYRSINKLCDYYHITPGIYNRRLEKGWTQEQALTRPVLDASSRYVVTDHVGNRFLTIGEMCKYYHITRGVYDGRIKHGWPVKEALTTPIRKIVTDHWGNKYSSVTEMCQRYGIKLDTYLRRINYGWTQEQALTLPSRYTILDCFGNKFKSKINTNIKRIR